MTSQIALIPAPSPSPVESINLALRDHQSSVDTWDCQAAAADLHLWAERFILEFKLRVGVPALLIQPLRGRYGHFRRGRNGFGLLDEIGIDRRHFGADPYWQVCATLLHELLHCWQHHFGDPRSSAHKPNYHNKEFRDKALEFGLQVDERGITQCLPGDTPFIRLLRKYGVKVPDLPPLRETPVAPRVGSKLRLWECPCGVKVRVGRTRFHARCLDCGGLFVLQGSRRNSAKEQGAELPSFGKSPPRSSENGNHQALIVRESLQMDIRLQRDLLQLSSTSFAPTQNGNLQ